MFFLNRLKAEFSRDADGYMPNENFAVQYRRSASCGLPLLLDFDPHDLISALAQVRSGVISDLSPQCRS
jgi:hypothetical protein